MAQSSVKRALTRVALTPALMDRLVALDHRRVHETRTIRKAPGERVEGLSAFWRKMPESAPTARERIAAKVARTLERADEVF